MDIHSKGLVVGANSVLNVHLDRHFRGLEPHPQISKIISTKQSTVIVPQCHSATSHDQRVEASPATMTAFGWAGCQCGLGNETPLLRTTLPSPPSIHYSMGSIDAVCNESVVLADTKHFPKMTSLLTEAADLS